MIRKCDLFDFLGRWRLSREIEDARGGLAGRLEGWAIFSPQGTGLACEETGLLSYGDAPAMQATRRYIWRAEGDRIAVYFDDGRPFHSFVPGPRAEATHDCAPDRYEVAYDFTGWPRWEAVWTVRGPRKDYVMTSRYSPEG